MDIFQMDNPFKYISFFLEDDEYDYIRNEHMVGRMSTTQVKDRLIQTLSQIVEAHSIARAAVTNEVEFLAHDIPNYAFSF